MIIIADTSPINYLILIDEIDVLRALYGRVLIPPTVEEELTRSRAPEAVRLWLGQSPIWLEVRAPLGSADRQLAQLDPGERDAMLLAEELHADQLIIDESRGRQEAQRRHLPFTGTLGILRAGAKSGLLDLKSAVRRLRLTSFHVSEDVLDRLIEGQE
jgi:predicted nucleic acid-binding protein